MKLCERCGGPMSEKSVSICGCGIALAHFSRAMDAELRANAEKGGRNGPEGWVEGMTPEHRISELLYHTAKLAYAQRQFLQGEGDEAQVLEFAADVGNCAMMIPDGLGLLIP